MYTFRCAIRCYLDTETGQFETYDTTAIEGTIDEDELNKDEEMDEENKEEIIPPQISEKKPVSGKARVEARKKQKRGTPY